MEANNKSTNIIKGYIRYILKNYIWIILCGLLLATLLGAYAYFSKVKYEAKITFDLNQEDETGGIQLPGALASLGVNTGAQGFNMFKVLSLAHTENVLFDVLMDSVENRRMIDLVLDNYTIEDLKINQITGNDFDKLSQDEKVLLNDVKLFIQQERLFQINYDKKSEIFGITAMTLDEDLSYYLVQSIFKYIDDFYKDQKKTNAKLNFDRLQLRLDSTQQILKKNEVNYARLKDKNKGVIFGRDQLQELRAYQAVQINTEMYIEILKNYELAKYKLESITPTFNVVDKPFKPLKQYKKGMIKYGILGFVLGILLSGFVISIRYFVVRFKNKI